MATIFDRKKAETVLPQLEKGASLVTKRLTKVSKAADDAATKATGFIKPTSSEGGQDDGVMIFPKAEESNPQNYVYIDTDSVDIYRDGNLVATFSGDKIEMYNESAIPLFSIISGDINPNVVERKRTKVSTEGSAVSKTFYTKFPISTFSSLKLKYQWLIPISGEAKGNGTVTLSATETSKTIHEYGYDIGAVSISNITENSFTITISTDGGASVNITDEEFSYTTISPSSAKLEYGAYPSELVEALLKVGNGTSDISKSNAFAVDWNGNGFFGGDLYANCDANSENGKRVTTTADAFISDIRVLPSTTSYVFSANEYRNDLMPIIGTKIGYVPIVYSVECSNSQYIDVVNWSTYGTEGYVEVHAINRSSSSRSGVKFKIKILWIPEDLIATDNGSFIDITGGGSPSPDTPSGGGGIGLPSGGETGDMLVKADVGLEWEHKERLTNTEIEDMINAMA